jgi:hypothetical protein
MVQPLNSPGLTQKHLPVILSQEALGQHSVMVVDNLTSLINYSVLWEGEVVGVILVLHRILGVRISRLALE